MLNRWHSVYMKAHTSSAAPGPRLLRALLTGLALVYALVAGLRTVADFDLGWQMAESRLPVGSTEALSYTAHGAYWIYPRLAGVVFRSLIEMGGYAAISWLCAAAMVVIAVAVAWRASVATLLLLLLATPAIAAQLIPRSSLFTVVFSAVYVSLLMSWRARGDNRLLWPLPILMVLWVNLHTGFIAGLGLLLAFVAVTYLDRWRSVQDHDPKAWTAARLKALGLTLAATATATLLNPWGIKTHAMILSHEGISHTGASLLVELMPLYKGFPWQSTHLAAPQGATWLIVLVAAPAVFLLLWQRDWGLALFLTTAEIACVSSMRSQGLFLPIACIAIGHAISRLKLFDLPISRSYRKPIQVGIAISALAFVTVRCADIISGKTSLREGQITSFGAGPSWWLPVKAVDFLSSSHLPQQVFSTMNLSSYLSWRLAPDYLDFADGRYIPFGDPLAMEQVRLGSLSLDSPEWAQAADHYGIHTVIYPLSRLMSVGDIPLKADCESVSWRPVYLDSKAIVFVRNQALPATIHPLDCKTHTIALPAAPPDIATPAHMDAYQSIANTAVLYYLLGRQTEAQKVLDQALAVTNQDYTAALLQGQMEAQAGQLDTAEHDIRRSLALAQSDAAWYQLALLYAGQQQYDKAMDAMKRSAALSPASNFPQELMLAKLSILSGDLPATWTYLDKATAAIAMSGLLGGEPGAQVQELRATALAQQGNWTAAVEAQRAAVALTPEAAGRWAALAQLERAAGQLQEADQAQQRAATLAAAAPQHEP